MSAIARKCPAFPVSVRVQQMNRDKIKVDHCYSMTPVNGRRTIARVTNLFKITPLPAVATLKVRFESGEPSFSATN